MLLEFISKNKKKVYFRHWIAIAVFALLSVNAQASEVVLQDVKITQSGAETQIELGLGRSLGYVKHFPQTFGEIIQIQLSLDSDKARLIHKEVKQGSELRAPGGQAPILIYVTYEEGVPGGPYLTLRFVKPMEFKVEPKSDTSLLVTVNERLEENKAADATTSPQSGIPESLGGRVDTKKPGSGRGKDVNVGELMAKARQALTFGDNEGSARLLRKIIAIPDNPHAQEARELLGLSLERSKQIPRAKFEYQKYLELYKKGDGPKRVRQRLQALENLGIIKKRKKLRVAKRDRKADSFKVFGRFMQDVGIRLTLEEQEENEQNQQDSVFEKYVTSTRFSNHLTVRTRYQDGTRVITTAVTGSSTWSESGNTERTRNRPSDFYIQGSQNRETVYGTLGLHRARNAGVFQRFWGVTAGFKPSDGLDLSLLSGKPHIEQVSYDKDFFAVKMGIGKRRAPVSGNLYLVNQGVESLSDREAIGGDLRYSEKTVTLFGSMDYDTLFKEPTLASVRWGWQYDKKSRLNVSYDYRALVNTSNLINKITPTEYDAASGNPTGSPAVPLTDFSALQALLSQDRIYELAKLYTYRTHNITVGSSIQYDKDNQINVDLSMYKTDELKGANFLEEENTLAERIYGNDDPNDSVYELKDIGAQQDNQTIAISAQLIASNAWVEKDLHVIGVRASQFKTGGVTTSKDVSLFMNSRLPPWNKLNPRPRVNVSYRSYAIQGNPAARLLLSPSIKLDYRWKKEWVFDFELGYDFLTYSGSNTPSNDNHISARFGYNYTF